MAAPDVKWFDVTNSQQQFNWNIGVVTAGDTSPDTTFLIWNNRNGGTDVSDMVNCTVTTKDTNGQNTGVELVTGQWVKVKCVSGNDQSFYDIGGATVRPVKAGGAAPLQTIKGTANDGSINAVNNYAVVTLHAVVPSLALAGTLSFITRVAYQYT